MESPGALRSCLLLAVATLGACAPLSAVPPFHLTETTEVLRAGEVSVNLAGGIGGAALDGHAAGGGARLRVGVGGRQEIGVEATGLAVDTGTPDSKSPVWIGQSMAYGGKLAWKLSPVDWCAFVLGAGGTQSATGTALGGDAAVIFGAPFALGHVARPYGGVRGTFAVPINRDLDSAGGVTAGFVIPTGVSLEPNEWFRFFVEGGLSMLWSHPDQSPPVTSSLPTQGHFGLYGAVGVSFVLGRSAPTRLEESEEPGMVGGEE